MSGALRTGPWPTPPASPSRWCGRSGTTSRPGSQLCSARSCTSPDHQLFPLSKGAHPMADKPSVLFVCVHNAGRSQMAAGFLTHLGGGRVEVRSAGSIPGDQVNPSAVAAMAEVGIDISAQTPKVLTADAVQSSDVVITMGCGDACPIFPGKRYL